MQSTHQQLSEVGVAARPRHDISDELLRRRSTKDLNDLFTRLVRVEPREHELRYTRKTTHVGQPAVQRMPHRAVLLPDRDHQRQVLSPETGDQIGQHVQRRDVSPLQVIDDDDRGLPVDDPVNDPVHHG